MENLIKTGARKGKSTAFRKWISKVAAPVLVVFPVPGENYFRSHGIYLHDFFDVAANPREANVLLVGGPVSQKLAQKIAVVYLQMPRPRALIFAGTENIPVLPEPDFKVDLNDEEIRNLKTSLIRKFRNAYREAAEDYQPDFTKEMLEEDHGGGHEHHHGHDHGGNGQEEDHQHEEHDHNHQKHHQHENEGDHKKHEQENDDEGHGSHGHEMHDHSGHEHQHSDEHKKHHQHKGNHEGHQHEENENHGDEEHDHEKHKHEGHEHGGHDHSDHNHGSPDHGGHDHGGMGFMSMVEMTKDMPRAIDGLAMERNQVWFGPFFPGLPGGLAFQFTIDGDTVVEVQAEKGLFENTISISGELTPEKLLHKIAEMNPLIPNTYRILGEQLLKKSAGRTTGLTRQQIISLEKERVASHLNWLSTFGILVGNQWMEKEAARQMRKVQDNDSVTELNEFIQKIQGLKLLKNKLQKTGEIPENLLHHTSGPTAKAAGKTDDTRSTNETYKSAGFETVFLNENNPWGRLQLRLLEMEESLKILLKLENDTDDNQQKENYSFGESTSIQLEGPAGIIEAELQYENGRFKKVKVTEASAIHTVLAEQLVKEMELSDALVTIASLDINPFAVNGKYIEHQND